MGAQETHSPVIQMGKEVRKIYTCSSGMLKEYEHDIVKDIFSSPKVYLMTQGYDFQRNDGFWLEVKVTSNNVKVKDAKNKSIEYILTFEVPTTGALTL